MAAAKKQKKRRKKSSYWSPAAVTGRVIWGRGGFKGVVRQAWREWVAPHDVTPARPNPDAGKLKAAGAGQRKDGTWAVKPPRPPKRMSVKKRLEQMQTRIAIESDRHAKYLEAQAEPRSVPQSERVRRKSDGKFNGSNPGPAKQKPPTYAQAQREVAKAMRNAAEASKHAEELLRWQQPPSR